MLLTMLLLLFGIEPFTAKMTAVLAMLSLMMRIMVSVVRHHQLCGAVDVVALLRKWKAGHLEVVVMLLYGMWELMLVLHLLMMMLLLMMSGRIPSVLLMLTRHHRVLPLLLLLLVDMPHIRQ